MSFWEAMEDAYDEAFSKAGVASDAEIKVMVNGVGRAPTKLRKTFKKSDLVNSLRQAVKDEIMPDTTPSLWYAGVPLEDGKKFSDYDMIDDLVNVSIARRLNGGSALPDSSSSIRTPAKRMHMFSVKKHPGLTVTDKADDLMHVDSKKNLRVVCPCKKHAFVAQTYFMLLKTVIGKDSCSYRVYCPMPKCGVEIPFSFLMKAGDLNREEVKYYSYHIGMRSLRRTTVECPGCCSRCSLPDRLDYVRVSCGCGASDFCYQCRKPWKGGGFQICGNTGCSTESLKTAIETCELIELSGGFKCPKLRACPKCLSLIEWRSACKHFNCTGCKCSFCFLCLKPRSKCKNDSYTVFCELADRQKLK